MTNMLSDAMQRFASARSVGAVDQVVVDSGSYHLGLAGRADSPAGRLSGYRGRLLCHEMRNLLGWLRLGWLV